MEKAYNKKLIIVIITAFLFSFAVVLTPMFSTESAAKYFLNIGSSGSAQVASIVFASDSEMPDEISINKTPEGATPAEILSHTYAYDFSVSNKSGNKVSETAFTITATLAVPKDSGIIIVGIKKATNNLFNSYSSALMAPSSISEDDTYEYYTFSGFAGSNFGLSNGTTNYFSIDMYSYTAGSFAVTLTVTATQID